MQRVKFEQASSLIGYKTPYSYDETGEILEFQTITDSEEIFSHLIRCQQCAVETYVDDTELILSMNHTHLNMIIKEMQSIAQFWEQLLYMTGGALTLLKKWFLLPWHGTVKMMNLKSKLER